MKYEDIYTEDKPEFVKKLMKVTPNIKKVSAERRWAFLKEIMDARKEGAEVRTREILKTIRDYWGGSSLIKAIEEKYLGKGKHAEKKVSEKRSKHVYKKTPAIEEAQDDLSFLSKLKRIRLKDVLSYTNVPSYTLMIGEGFTRLEILRLKRMGKIKTKIT